MNLLDPNWGNPLPLVLRAHHYFSIIRSLFEAIFSQNVAKDRRKLNLGNTLCTFNHKDACITACKYSNLSNLN